MIGHRRSSSNKNGGRCESSHHHPYAAGFLLAGRRDSSHLSRLWLVEMWDSWHLAGLWLVITCTPHTSCTTILVPCKAVWGAEVVHIGQDYYCRDRHDRIVNSWQNSLGHWAVCWAGVGVCVFVCHCVFVFKCMYLHVCLCVCVFAFMCLPLRWSKGQLATYGTVVTLQVPRSAMWSHLLFRSRPLCGFDRDWT